MSEDKVQWTLELIEKLQKNGIGDLQKFDAIRSYLERDEKLTDADREYLKEKYKELQQLEKSGGISKITTESEEGDVVENLKNDVKDLKEKLEKIQAEQDTNLVIMRKSKSESTTLVLSLVPGLFGLLGIGRMYISGVGGGVAILIIGLFLSGWGVWAFYSGGWVALVIYFIIFIWLIFDGRNECRVYNERLRASEVERKSYA